MRCDELERWMAARMGGDGEDPSGQAPPDPAVLEHVRGCEACSSLEDLVRWLMLPEQARAPVDEPGPDYWERFPDRVLQALDAQAPRRRPMTWRALAAAAVLILAVGVAWWGFLRDGGGGAEPFGGWEGAEAMPEVIDRASPDAAAAALEAFAETVDPAAFESYALPDPWVDDTAELDDETRREILKWLESDEAGDAGGPA